ncbi:hypothetical protein [Streptomyces sp. NPDC008121]|uniref:hypothetical protein n=1 Tax=Streptomyces sp. NPDC008121 TaxID=3364809 RepID=UPI0036EED58E
MSLNRNGARTTPFRVRGLPVDEVFAHFNNPGGVADLDQAIDTSLNRRPLRDILDDLGALDATVLAHHPGLRPGGLFAGDPTSIID